MSKQYALDLPPRKIPNLLVNPNVSVAIRAEFENVEEMTIFMLPTF